MGQYSSHFLKLPRRAGMFALVTVCASAISQAQTKQADVIVTHARVYTVNAKQQWAEGVAIKGERIAAVGNAKQIEAWRGPKTQLIDAHGRLVLPGFTDSHIHFMEGSQVLTWVHLEETRNLDQIRRALRKYAAEHPVRAVKSPWILGRGWTYDEFGASGLPHKKYLDDLFPDRPVFLEGFDGHTAWINSKGLEITGVTRLTPDPPNGRYVRDAGGEPTGALQEEAYSDVAKKIPLVRGAELAVALREGMKEANRVGITRIVTCGNDTGNFSDDDVVDTYQALRAKNELSLRVIISNYEDPSRSSESLLGDAERLRRQLHPNDPWLAAGAVKFFLDGVIEAHTAAMLEPYSDAPSIRGSLRWDLQRFKNMVAQFDRQGFQIYTHAIGDKAVRTALDAYEAAAKANGTQDARHRIEHIETIAAEDIPRFGKLGVIASFQPLHAYPDKDTLDVWLKNVGEERGTRAWAWQSIARSGGRLAFGSDWPVVTLNPWYGVQNAVTRQTRDGKPAEGFVPKERVSLQQAIEGYTLGAAIGARKEKNEGSIDVGKLADLIILSQDLFLIDPNDIYKTQVLLTMVGGKIVYQSPEWKSLRPKSPTKGN